MKRLEFLKYLAAHHCVVTEEGGRHTHLENTRNGNQSVLGRHRELDNRMARIICKQLGIPPML